MNLHTFVYSCRNIFFIQRCNSFNQIKIILQTGFIKKKKNALELKERSRQKRHAKHNLNLLCDIHSIAFSFSFMTSHFKAI